MTSDAERIAVLETQMRHIDEKLDENSRKLDEIHAAFLAAKGAKWIIVGMASVGGAIAAFLIKLLPLSGALPK
jgi:hypothetical protein